MKAAMKKPKGTAPFNTRTIMQYERDCERVQHTVIEDNVTGVLTCTCIGSERVGMPPWCEHIENVIKDQLDARPMGANPTIAFRELPRGLVVPMIPSERFWVQVELGDEPDFKSVWLDSGLGVRSIKPGEDPWIPVNDGENEDVGPALGYLGPGEGRRMIRAMVFEWLRPQRKRVHCKSKVHKTQRWSKADRHDSALAPADWAALWCLVAQGYCKDCLTYTADYSQDAPVLSTVAAMFEMDPVMKKNVQNFLQKWDYKSTKLHLTI